MQVVHAVPPGERIGRISGCGSGDLRLASGNEQGGDGQVGPVAVIRGRLGSERAQPAASDRVAGVHVDLEGADSCARRLAGGVGEQLPVRPLARWSESATSTASSATLGSASSRCHRATPTVRPPRRAAYASWVPGRTSDSRRSMDGRSHGVGMPYRSIRERALIEVNTSMSGPTSPGARGTMTKGAMGAGRRRRRRRRNGVLNTVSSRQRGRGTARIREGAAARLSPTCHGREVGSSG